MAVGLPAKGNKQDHLFCKPYTVNTEFKVVQQYIADLASTTYNFRFDYQLREHKRSDP